ncbi:MAG: 50S ribosomal protein L7/L12 [Cytophagales bacterium]
MSELKLFAEKLVNLSVKEVNELAEILKSEHGINPISSFSNLSNSDAKESKKEEKTAFDLVLKAIGGSKLSIVKLVKEITGKGLKESKDLVDSAPKSIKNGLSKKDAEAMKLRFEDLGAEVELN